MPRIFYDSVTATDIPVNVNGKPIDGVLGYADGRYVWTKADWDRFSSSTVKLRIAISPNIVAEVLDVESGNPATPMDCVSWVALCKTHGIFRPTIYCSRTVVPSIVQAFRSVYAPVPDFDVADWTGKPHTVTLEDVRFPCVQFASPETHSGGHYDLNVVWDDGWYPAPGAVPSPNPIVPVHVVTDPVKEACKVFPVLRLGDTNAKVKMAQGLLNAYGYGLVQDGSFGPKTEAAILGFQKNHPPLSVDGLFGPETCAAALND